MLSIGEVIISLNDLESSIDFWIWELLGTNGTPSDKQVIGRLVTNKLDFIGKADLLRSLIVHRSGEDKAKIFFLHTSY